MTDAKAILAQSLQEPRGMRGHCPPGYCENPTQQRVNRLEAAIYLALSALNDNPQDVEAVRRHLTAVFDKDAKARLISRFQTMIDEARP